MAEVSRDRERWLPVVGLEGFYEVSDLGRVRSVDRTYMCANRWGTPRMRTYRGRMLSQGITGGRFLVNLCVRRGRTRLVHQLVMEAFGGPRPPGMVCCHNDGNPTNNVITNLRWDTSSGNNFDRGLHGTDHNLNKDVCPLEHLLISPNLRADVRPGWRGCLACHRAQASERYARRHGRPFDMIRESNERYIKIMGL